MDIKLINIDFILPKLNIYDKYDFDFSGKMCRIRDKDDKEIILMKGWNGPKVIGTNSIMKEFKDNAEENK